MTFANITSPNWISNILLFLTDGFSWTRWDFQESCRRIHFWTLARCTLLAPRRKYWELYKQSELRWGCVSSKSVGDRSWVVELFGDEGNQYSIFKAWYLPCNLAFHSVFSPVKLQKILPHVAIWLGSWFRRRRNCWTRDSVLYSPYESNVDENFCVKSLNSEKWRPSSCRSEMSKCSDTEACEISLPVVDSFSLLSRVYSTSGRETGSVFSCLIQKSRTSTQEWCVAVFWSAFVSFRGRSTATCSIVFYFPCGKSKKQEPRRGIV